MEKLISILYECVINNQEVSEDLLYELEQDVICVVRNQNTTQISRNFWDLQHYIEMYWRGRKYTRERNKKYLYQMGQLLAYTNMVRDIVDIKENESDIS